MLHKKAIRDVPESSARIVVYIVKFAKNDEKKSFGMNRVHFLAL